MTLLIQVFARLLLLPILIASLAMLVHGYVDTGDGFSAGLIAATGFLLQYVAFGYREAGRLLPVRVAPGVAFAGLLIILVVAFATVLRGEPVLTHHPRPGTSAVHLGSLEVHTAVLFDIGVYLLTLGFTVTAIAQIGRLAERRAT